MDSVHVTSAAAQCRLIKYEEAWKLDVAQSSIIHVNCLVGAASLNNVRILLGTRC